MTDKEHKDVYIAAAVGGVALILILLYMYGGTNTAAQTAEPSDAIATPPAAQTPYNYNVAPYQPGPPIQFGAATPANSNKAGGCCDRCGPAIGNDIFSTSVAQFQTLISMGGG